MKRRAFLAVGGQTVIFALAPQTTKSGLLFGQQESQVAPEALEQRIASVIQAYDAQGNHRTGTQVDNASAEWLANQVLQLGAESSLEPFTLNRVDPQSCYLRIAGRASTACVCSTPVLPAPRGYMAGSALSAAITKLG